MMEVDRNSREVLDRAGCLRLLSRATLGRLAFTSGTPPSVVPVRYHLDGDRILVRTRRGGRLDAALSDAVAAFEVDDVEPVHTAGGASRSLASLRRSATDRARGRPRGARRSVDGVAG
jgi:nitroimidazol reductase NimA-like FMN-containing flavoprotein (pyridoxamine 5'-phosphate oxidase superfamily)